MGEFVGRNLKSRGTTNFSQYKLYVRKKKSIYFNKSGGGKKFELENTWKREGSDSFPLLC